MPFVPRAIGRSSLRYPQNKWAIAFQSQAAKERWYAAQDPQELAESSKDFAKFWARWYVGHVKLKRFLFRFKFW